jgi:hypothetical protein
MALRLLSNRAVRAFLLPRRGLDDFVTGSAPPPAAAKGKDAAKGEQAADATAAGRPWKAVELRRMYQAPPFAFSLAVTWALPRAPIDPIVTMKFCISLTQK